MKALIYGIVGVAAAGAIIFIVGATRAPSLPGVSESSSPQQIGAPQPEEAAVSQLQASLGTAPNFSLANYAGETVRFLDFAGKSLVLNSWAVWCPFCRQELVDFAAAQKEFGDKVVIVAINRQESLATAKSYTDTQGTSNSLIFLLDPSDSFYQAIGGFSMPETIFVDKSGNIVDHKRGPMDINEIRERIKKIIQ